MQKKLTNYRKLNYLAIASLSVASALFMPKSQAAEPDKTKFHFTVTADSHMGRNSADFAKFVCPAILANPNGPGAFMVNTGDSDVFSRVSQAIIEQLIKPLQAQGKDYFWYPVPGNHDLYNTSNDPGFRTEVAEQTQTRALIDYNKKNLKHIINWGPKFDSKLIGYENNGSQYTSYSFDYGNSHFVVLDLYYPNSIPARGNANFHKVTEQWLENDLKKNKLPNIFVFGHQPIIKYKYRYENEIVPKKDLVNFRRQQFWNLLKKYKINAYFSGHTHRYGSVVKDGITQLTNSKSGLKNDASYVMVFVDGDKIAYKTYIYHDESWQEDSGTIKPTPANTPTLTVIKPKTATSKVTPATAATEVKVTMNSKPQPEALIGYWSFDTDKGKTVVDSSSNNNNGQLYETVEYTTGVNQQAVAVGKTSKSYIKIPASGKIWRKLKQLTVAGWFYREDGAGAVTGLDKSQNYRLTSNAVDSTSAKWTFSVVDDKGSFHSVSTSKTVNNNEWHHLAGTYDGQTLKIYLDGVEAGIRNVTFAIKDAGGNFEIGRRDGIKYFKGRIDEVGIYRIALSQDEIIQVRGQMEN